MMNSSVILIRLLEFIFISNTYSSYNEIHKLMWFLIVSGNLREKKFYANPDARPYFALPKSSRSTLSDH